MRNQSGVAAFNMRLDVTRFGNPTSTVFRPIREERETPACDHSYTGTKYHSHSGTEVRGRAVTPSSLVIHALLRNRIALRLPPSMSPPNEAAKGEK
jgi:hypothetical protein